MQRLLSLLCFFFFSSLSFLKSLLFLNMFVTFTTSIKSCFYLLSFGVFSLYWQNSLFVFLHIAVDSHNIKPIAWYCIGSSHATALSSQDMNRQSLSVSCGTCHQDIRNGSPDLVAWSPFAVPGFVASHDCLIGLGPGEFRSQVKALGILGILSWWSGVGVESSFAMTMCVVVVCSNV